MGSSRPRNLFRTWRRNRRKSKTIPCRGRKRLRTVGNGRRVDSGVSAKLEALKNLIPSRSGEIKDDRLFEETADYIVFLKAQVEILQRLNDFYGSDEKKEVV